MRKFQRRLFAAELRRSKRAEGESVRDLARLAQLPVTTVQRALTEGCGTVDTLLALCHHYNLLLHRFYNPDRR